jgi:hypothetical protein
VVTATYNGTPTTITFVMNPAAKETYGMITDPGNVVNSTLKLMTKGSSESITSPN